MALPIQSRIKLFQGDITTLDCEVIVTAANEALCGGGGVDGAVHNAAGPELVRASTSLGPCPAGEARITDGFDLDAKFVIHAVGPIFRNLDHDKEILAEAYRSSLKLAATNDARSIAFPCISTGAFGFPVEPACEIAVETVVSWLHENDLPALVIFCCFEQDDFNRYEKRLARV